MNTMHGWLTPHRLVASALGAVLALTGCAAEMAEPIDGEDPTAEQALCRLRDQPQGTDRCGDFDDFALQESIWYSQVEQGIRDGAPGTFRCGEGHGCNMHLTGWFNGDWCNEAGYTYKLSYYSREDFPLPTVEVETEAGPVRTLALTVVDGNFCRPSTSWPIEQTADGVRRYEYECFSPDFPGGKWGKLAGQVTNVIVSGTLAMVALVTVGEVLAVYVIGVAPTQVGMILGFYAGTAATGALAIDTVVDATNLEALFKTDAFCQMLAGDDVELHGMPVESAE